MANKFQNIGNVFAASTNKTKEYEQGLKPATTQKKPARAKKPAAKPKPKRAAKPAKAAKPHAVKEYSTNLRVSNVTRNFLLAYKDAGFAKSIRDAAAYAAKHVADNLSTQDKKLFKQQLKDISKIDNRKIRNMK